MEILKVSAKTHVIKVAGAIAGIMREKKSVEVQAVGAAAVNQAVKAIAIARGFLAPNGIEVVCRPAFFNVEIKGEDRSAIKIVVEEKRGL